MQPRKRRPTFDIVVKNLPKVVTQKDVNKKFTAYGEIMSLYIKQTDEGKEAVIKYLCEPDADKAVADHHGSLWGNNILVAKRSFHKPGAHVSSQGSSNRLPFYKPTAVNNIRHTTHMNMQIPPCFTNLYNDGPLTLPPPPPQRKASVSHSWPNSRGAMRNMEQSKCNFAKEYASQIENTVCDIEYGNNTETFGMSSASPYIRELHCTFVEDCVTFYGQCSTKMNTLEALSSRLQRICPSFPVIKCVPSIGDMYAALYSGDQQWYRCKILFNNRIPGKSYVQYIDYGNCEDVEFSKIVELPKSITETPYYAPKCVLVTVDRLTDKKLCQEASIYLQEYLLGKTITVHSYSAVDSPRYEVIECKLNGTDVIRDLAKNRYVTYRNSPQPNYAALGQQHYNQASIPSPTSSVNSFESGHNKPKPKSFCMNPVKNTPTEPKKVNKFAVNKTEKKNSFETKDEVSQLEREKSTKEIQFLKKELEGWQQKYKALEKSVKEKEAETLKYNVIKQLETVASHVQLVNSIRSNPPTNDIDVSNALAMLLRINSSSSQQKHKLKKTVDDALTSYHQLLNDIAICSEKAAQDELVLKKNSQKEKLCQDIKKYEELYESENGKNVEIDVSAIQEILKKLQTKMKSTVDVTLNNNPSSIDDILLEYNTTMLVKKERTEKLKKETDIVHAEFYAFFSDLLKSFHLCRDDDSLDNKVDKNLPFLLPGGILTSDKLKKQLDSLWVALEAEVKSLYSECDFKDTTKYTLVECLIRELENVEDRDRKEKVLIKKYLNIAEELSDNILLPQKLIELVQIKQDIKAVKSKLRHALVDKKDLEEGDHFDGSEIKKVNANIKELQNALHNIYITEDALLKLLAQSCKTNYPEFNLQHPELNLVTYKEYDGLYKQNWEFEQFSCQKSIERGSMCYEALFADKPVIIKEFLLDHEEKSANILMKIKQWHSLSSNYLVPILAIFKKGDRQMFVMTPHKRLLLEQEKSLSKSERCDILISVLEALCVLHKNNVIHGSINSSTIFLDEKAASLDFCFGDKYSEFAFGSRKAILQPPEIFHGAGSFKASDMFSFGCLVLSVLLPNLELSCAPGNVPDISMHKKEIKKVLSAADYTTIAALLHIQSVKRPTAETLLKSTFLRDISISSKEHIDEQIVLSETQPIPTKNLVEAAKSSAMTEVPILPPKPLDSPVLTPAQDQSFSNNDNNKADPLTKLSALRESLISKELVGVSTRRDWSEM